MAFRIAPAFDGSSMRSSITPATASVGRRTADAGIPVRHAALIAVIALLLTTFGVPIAELGVWPSIVIPHNIEQTVRNIRANEGAYLFMSFAYLIGFVGDVVVAWALYYLLRPVHRPLAALAAALRALQAVIAIGAALNLFTAYRLLQTDSLEALGSNLLNAQILVLLRSFSYGWGLALIIFGIHLALLGYLVFRSGYIPRLVGIALAVAGLGYVVYHLQPYLYPGVEVGFVFVAFLGELVFVAWLAIWGWRIPEPTRASAT